MKLYIPTKEAPKDKNEEKEEKKKVGYSKLKAEDDDSGSDEE